MVTPGSNVNVRKMVGSRESNGILLGVTNMRSLLKVWSLGGPLKGHWRDQ